MDSGVGINLESGLGELLFLGTGQGAVVSYMGFK
jgi:hypothetical protein